MSITNEARYHLQERANEVLGEKEGTTLMELLPPVGWADVATKSDLDVQTTLLRSEIGSVRSEIGSVRSDLDAQTSRLRSEFRADLESGLRQLETRMFTAFLTVIGVLATMAGLLIAVLLRS